MLRSTFHRFFGPIAARLGYFRPLAASKPRAVDELGQKNDLLMSFYAAIDHAGWKPKHLMDVGANRGTWAQAARRAFPNALITMLEPQSWLRPSPQEIAEKDPNMRYFPVGAGRVAGSFSFTLAERDDSSTFRLSKQEAESRGLEQREIPVVTLDGLVREQGLPVPDIVKIDAEGLDLDVLEGASSLLGRTEVFMVEAGIVNKIFPNSVSRMISYMESKGYVLFDITDLNRPWKAPVLWLVELVFVKRDGVLDAKNWRA
ncbi:MAG: FkbM family methyltransferase [Flavobacteriales bacterium]